MEAWIIIIAGFLIGGGIGLYLARSVKMTAMPQLVSLFNAVGGGAAALVAISDYFRIVNTPENTISTAIFVILGVAIGSITFSGSIVAAAKLQGLIPGAPIIKPWTRPVTLGAAAITGIGTLILVLDAAGIFGLDVAPSNLLLIVIFGSALVFGVTLVLPIGGADMPVVISLLNSFTGTAAAMSGFVIGNPVLIIAGALVGASGAILTKLMADAMNRSIWNIMVGGFGGGDARSPARRARAARAPRCARSTSTTRPSCWPTPRRSSWCPATVSRSPRPSTRCASWPRCSRLAAWTWSTPSIPWPAACRVT